MPSHDLIVEPVILRPNPPPYGGLWIGKGAWDQLQAKRAYDELQEPTGRPSHLDKRV